MMGFLPFLKLKNILLTVFPLPIIPDRHLGSFHLLAVVNHASVNMDVKLITL